MSAYDDLMESLRKRVDSGAQAEDEAKDAEAKRQAEEKARADEEVQRAKDRENATGNRVKEGLRRWINGDMYRRGGASDDLKRKRPPTGGVRG